ncbi:MAG: chemotaxis protein CheW [Myxococcota bacterium]
MEGQFEQTTVASRETEDVVQELLCFEIGDHRYAIETSRVLAVVGTAPITRLPKAPIYVLGVFNHHGQVTAVFDLALFEGRESTEHAPRMLVVSGGVAMSAAVPVHQIVGIASVLRSTFNEPLPHLRQRGYVRAQVRHEDKLYTLLDPAQLLDKASAGAV